MKNQHMLIEYLEKTYNLISTYDKVLTSYGFTSLEKSKITNKVLHIAACAKQKYEVDEVLNALQLFDAKPKVYRKFVVDYAEWIFSPFCCNTERTIKALINFCGKERGFEKLCENPYILRQNNIYQQLKPRIREGYICI